MNYELAYRHIAVPEDDLGRSKALFEGAFPPEERPDFETLIGFKNASFYEVTDRGEFVGIVVTVDYLDLHYVFFLAIDPEKRRHGYGSQILSDMKELHPGKRVFLLVDEPSPEFADYQVRLDRVAFYEGCGFRLTDIKIVEYEVDYRMMVEGEAVSKQEFLDLMRFVIGDELFRRYYL